MFIGHNDVGFASQRLAPRDPKKIAWGALTMILVPIWAAWIDRHRELRT